MRVLILVAAFIALALADNYGQSGCVLFSNNKLNDENNNVQNDKRLFNSQNNGNAGYMAAPDYKLYEGGIVGLEWTQQHACGANPKVFCEMIFQYLCDDTVSGIRNGDVGAGANGRATITEATQNDQTVGQHENFAFYDACNQRQRNKGLFAADQNVNNNNGAQASRQNPGATKYGFECQEERDYYPYWHPSPWKDIAVLTSNTSRCDMYKAESQNVKATNYCSGNAAANNEGACGATWTSVAGKGLPAPECSEAPWARDNHNGGVPGAYGGHAAMNSIYNYTLTPDMAGNTCVFRMRYNMSSSDYDGWAATSADNGETLIENDPTVDVGLGNDFQIALNTAQTSRTFQDRTHTFTVEPKPSYVEDGETLRHLCPRGTRGNIVQAYPRLEYGFSNKWERPAEGDWMYIQFAGTDYNQANQAGEGTDQTDRSNICGAKDNNSGHNRLAHLDDQYMFKDRDMAITACDAGAPNGGALEGSPGYVDVGPMQVEDQTQRNYLSSRNNQYTNRAQKAQINSSPTGLSLAAIIAIIVASTMLLAGAVGVGVTMYARANPHSKVGAMFARRSLLGNKSSGHSGYQSGGSYGSYQRRSYQSKGSKGKRSYGSRK